MLCPTSNRRFVPNADIELTGSRHQFNDPLRLVSAGDAKLTLRG